MKFITTLTNQHNQKYDLYSGKGVNLVPNGAKTPASGYESLAYIMQVKGFGCLDADHDRWLFDLVGNK